MSLLSIQNYSVAAEHNCSLPPSAERVHDYYHRRGILDFFKSSSATLLLLVCCVRALVSSIKKLRTAGSLLWTTAVVTLMSLMTRDMTPLHQTLTVSHKQILHPTPRQESA